jgi:hypothetical protein
VDPAPRVQQRWGAPGPPGAHRAFLTAPPPIEHRPPPRHPVPSVILMLAGGGTMYASSLPWIRSKVLTHTVYTDGTDHAVTRLIATNGWLTFAGGAALVGLGLLMLVLRWPLLRAVSLVVALAATGLAGYDTVRVIQKTERASDAAKKLGSFYARTAGDQTVAYGLLIVLGALIIGLMAATAAESASHPD